MKVFIVSILTFIGGVFLGLYLAGFIAGNKQAKEESNVNN